MPTRLLAALGVLALFACGDPPRVQTKENLPPTAKIAGGSRVASVGEVVSLDGRGSSDPEGALTFAWTFGDGKTSSEPLATHTFTAAAEYTVTLTVTDLDGSTAAASVTVAVTALAGNLPPQPRLTGDAQLEVGAAGHYDASTSSDSDGSIASFTWSFGDGAVATGPAATHAWAHPGTFEVTVLVTDDDGATADARLTLTVVPAANRPPQAVATASKTTAAPAEAIQFSGNASSDPDGTLAAWEWDFKDGSNRLSGSLTGGASVPLVQHAFAGVGSYDVALTVTDNQGLTGTATVAVTIAVLDYSGAYTVTANPSTEKCGISDANWVNTLLTVTVNGAAISATESIPPAAPIVTYSGSLAGTHFDMTGTYQTIDSGLTVDHFNHYLGDFQAGGHFTGTLTEHIVMRLTGTTVCDVLWHVSGTK